MAAACLRAYIGSVRLSTVLVLLLLATSCAPPRSSSAQVTGRDGAVMLLVAGGPFRMGLERQEADRAWEDLAGQLDDVDRSAYEQGVPSRRVEVAPFYMDRDEVTNAQFRRFVEATGHVTDAERSGHGWIWNEDRKHWEVVKGLDWRHPRGPDSAAVDDHPVVCVSYADAEAYATWAGKRLPTEEEWEKAARGADGRFYPWGREWKGVANVVSQGTAPVGSHPEDVSPYGLRDLGGNVSEWTQSPNPGAPDYVPPPGVDRGTLHKVRGAGWDCLPVNLQCPCILNTPVPYTFYTGFRCVQSAPSRG